MANPYLYANSDVLKNVAHIKDNETLAKYESTVAELSIANLYMNTFKVHSLYDIFKIHKYIFSLVYPWAGQARYINLDTEEYKDETYNYLDYEEIGSSIAKLEKEFLKNKWEKMDDGKLIKKISPFIISLWEIHPFREGNARTIGMFTYLFFLTYGKKIDLDVLSGQTDGFKRMMFESIKNPSILETFIIKMISNS